MSRVTISVAKFKVLRFELWLHGQTNITLCNSPVVLGSSFHAHITGIT
jgi:hypothetical protein